MIVFVYAKDYIYQSSFPSLATFGRCFDLGMLHNHLVPHFHAVHHGAAGHQLIIVEHFCVLRFLALAFLLEGAHAQRAHVRMTDPVVEGGADIEVVFCFGVDAGIVVESQWKFLLDGFLWLWESVGVDENF